MNGEHPDFSWDICKSDACFAERGFDFALASRLFEGPTFERTDRRREYGETRIQPIGSIEGRLFVVIYTQRGPVKHIMSARRAHEEEFAKWLK